MRILTVRQPWAWAIIHGGKDVENRVRNIAGTYRGPVAIHVALTWDGSPLDAANRVPALREAMIAARKRDGLGWVDRDNSMDDVRGHIIGVVELWAVHRDRDGGNCCPHRPVGGPGGSPWSERDVWHLCLNDPRPLANPIPYTGALGLRELPDRVASAIWGQL